MVKSAAYIRASAGGDGPKLRFSAHGYVGRVPLDQNHVDGRRRWQDFMFDLTQSGRHNDCSDRSYFKEAVAIGGFVFSDYVLARPLRTPMDDGGLSGVRDCRRRAKPSLLRPSISTGCRRSWTISAAGRGISTVLIDPGGPSWRRLPIRPRLIGRPLNNPALLAAIDDKAIRSDQATEFVTYTAEDDSKRAASSTGHSRHRIASGRQRR